MCMAIADDGLSKSSFVEFARVLGKIGMAHREEKGRQEQSEVCCTYSCAPMAR